MSLPSSADGNDFFGLGQQSGANELQSYRYPNFGDGLLEVVGTGAWQQQQHPPLFRGGWGGWSA